MNTTRTIALASFAALMIVLAGCVPSLHPIYSEADLVLEPKLEGVWKQPDSTATWTIKRAADKGNGAYTVLESDEDGKRGEFIARLAKIDGKLFLDLTAQEPKLDQSSDFYKMHLMPVHTFVRIDQVEPTLKATMIDVEWIKKHVEVNPTAIKHEIVEGAVVLTAPTKDLQKFYTKHIATADAYGDVMELTR